MEKGRSVRQHVTSRLNALRTEREPLIADWRDLSDYVLGSRGRFLVEDHETSRRNKYLYNETAKMAVNTLASGMMAGITSPARPWFKLGTPDPELMEVASVKEWLAKVEMILYQIFARSNFYNSMNSLYLELGTFGTCAMGIYEDFDTVARFEPYTAGAYCLGADGRRRVDTMYREYSMSVGRAVKRFGLENLSEGAQTLWRRGNYEAKLKIIHAIEPNIKADVASPWVEDKPYMSVYVEQGNPNPEATLLRSGFDERPFIAVRWEAIGEDVYASSYPGLNSLGTNKALQVEEMDLSIAIEKMHNPPLVGDAALEDNHDLIAGGISWQAGMGATGRPGIAPVYTVNPRVMELEQSIERKEQRILRHFYADLFLMITEMDRAQITATEIAERKEEKLLMLGTVLERLNNEALDPIIDRTYAIADRAGILPEPPPELEGMDLDVEYISVLAQAQKAVSTASMESTVAFAMGLAQVWPEARHKIDVNEAIEAHSRAKGAPPGILRTNDEAAAAAEAEMQQMQAAQAAAAVPAAAQTAKTLSETEPGGGDALSQMVGMNG